MKKFILALLFGMLISFTFAFAALESFDSVTQPSYESIKKEFDKQLNCLAENIYYESASEPFEGKLAVGQIVLNRVNNPNYPSDICLVVHQKNNGICQFSWYCDSTFTNRMLTIKHTPLYNEILQIATNLVVNFERMSDVTNGATYYHANYVNPGWRLTKVTQIGNHIFYRESKI